MNNPISEWFTDLASRPKPGNPCVKLYGPGPENARCRTCQFFIRRWRWGKPCFKCSKRAVTRGTPTDHRALWPACAKYQEIPKQ